MPSDSVGYTSIPCTYFFLDQPAISEGGNLPGAQPQLLQSLPGRQEDSKPTFAQLTQFGLFTLFICIKTESEKILKSSALDFFLSKKKPKHLKQSVMILKW